MEVDIKRLQDSELLIAEEIKRICEKYSIKYFLLAGSMLGAVRHKGFIPWDDDMDFGMLRDDYNFFCEKCKEDINSDFELINWDTDVDYPFSYAKVCLKGTLIKEKFAPPQKMSCIFVDIFPFDHVPVKKIEQKKQNRRIFLYRRILWIKKGYGRCLIKKGLRQGVKYIVSKILFSGLSYNRIKRKLLAAETMYNSFESDFFVTDSPYSYEKNIVKKEWLNDICLYEFDGHSFPGIRNYDQYLKNLYGDYWKLPPENKRYAHEIESVVFQSCFKH